MYVVLFLDPLGVANVGVFVVVPEVRQGFFFVFFIAVSTLNINSAKYILNKYIIYW